MPEDMVELKKEKTSSGLSDTTPDYMWGTSLSLRDDLVDDLKADNLSPGDMVMVRGLARVTSVSTREEENGVDVSLDKSVDIQFTHLRVDRENSDKAKQLYG